MDPHAQPFAIRRLLGALPRSEPHTPALPGAACRGLAPDVFFPAHGDVAGSRRAKAICATCPVRDECLDVALRNCERHGIWGGMTEHEWRAEARRRLTNERTTA